MDWNPFNRKQAVDEFGASGSGLPLPSYADVEYGALATRSEMSPSIFVKLLCAN